MRQSKTDTKKKTELPDKPSELIRLALHDLAEAERDKRYRIDMGAYHEPNSKCAVCFAGAVIAFSLNGSAKKFIHPNDFDLRTREKLHGLNELRGGFYSMALRHIEGLDWLEALRLRDKLSAIVNRPADYDDGRRAFKADMRKIAAVLEKEGH
jgi:hypothetical protein